MFILLPNERQINDTKKLLLSGILLASAILVPGCGENIDPGEPPSEGVNGSITSLNNTDSSIENGDILENVVSIRIGQNTKEVYQVDMYNIAASNTMLNYLSSSEMQFPTYTYQEDVGFVAQNIRGTYTRDDEVTVNSIAKGELYLFSGGNLRLYFKDVTDVNLTATKVGVVHCDDITNAVVEAYESNKNDVWGVKTYFFIKRNY